MLAKRSQCTAPVRASRVSRTTAVRANAAAWTRVSTQDELKSAGGKTVVEVGGNRILLTELDGEVLAVSNKCTHLGLPLVGKTAFMQGKIADSCIVCPAHNTAFSLKTGEVVGEWCPSFPSLPIIGKGTSPKPLPTYQVRVTDGAIEVFA